jgi:hypothetical protein
MEVKIMSEEEEAGEAIAELPIFARARLEAFREFIKEEYKKHIRQVYESDPELQKTIKEALDERAEARRKLASANMKLLRAGARLGIELREEELPRLLKRPIIRKIVSRMAERESKI